ncbi:MAG: molecular chaperone DnaK [Candidatus Nealsonbacteria bacterium CG23_combo_of_CG06-09_8_20_14_all_39_17]|uniref:Chaperone protein DnaK n=1 Tax=Candidatus Nealsonbacteria bacterium CG23_combo_of_CG06-09_8_20_14_all_39_17 TaxID=1974722 RepID=A0A2G9YVX7_9BACT|nr:MAG: molecular chaperone DnaK [Candidatus Nealsonbacteria bacterium CG23_combo_of_CG06-09_8_20_14_all_39_17]
MAKILGIDLGTTFSAMAVMEGGEAKIIDNKEGARTTPSVVAISKTGERLIGVVAKRQQITNSKNTIYSVKRLIGRRFTDTEVQRDKKLLAYEIKESSDGGVDIKIGEKWYKPAEISAMVLQKLKIDAEERLGEKIEEAIITCPAYFDDSQRKATMVAGEIAGFKVRRVINEPTAAALAYGLNKKKNEQVLIYDFGGGTFDVSILDIGEGTFEVKATGGDTHLGGDDIDQKIMDWLVSEFKKDQGIDLSKDQLALQRLKETSEKAKVELSTTLETEINIPFVTSDANGPKHLNYKFSRSKLEELVKEYIDRSIEKVKQTLKEGNFKPEDIEEIVLVGGQTRMPAIQEAVKKFFNKEPNKSINPDEVVALGAAIQGGILQGDVKDILLLDVNPLSLGIETLGGVNTILIPKNTTVPTAKTQVFSTATDSQSSVEIHILQGERPMASDSKTLGRFILDGIPVAPRGIPQIEVTFDIDANGILNVSAHDKATNKKQSIRIEGSTGLSKEEIERMKKEAEMNVADDQKKRDLIQARNEADSLIYSVEKTLKDAGDKVPAEAKKEVEGKMEELKKIKDGDDLESIKTKIADLSQTIQKIGAELYKNTQAPGQQPSDQKPEDKKEDGPEEAETKKE